MRYTVSLRHRCETWLIWVDSGYNPPEFILHTAKKAFDRVDANQYFPAKGRQSLRNALASRYSNSLER